MDRFWPVREVRERPPLLSTTGSNGVAFGHRGKLARAGRATKGNAWTCAPVFQGGISKYQSEETTLVAYTLFAYSARMVFVELTPFVAFRDEYWTDEDLRALQSFCSRLQTPEIESCASCAGRRKDAESAVGRG